MIPQGERPPEAAAPSPRPFALALGLLVLAATVVRLAVARPTFLHANFHGGPLVEAMLDYPEHAMGREATLGHFGFALLAGLARLFGRRAEVICAANQLFAAATLLVMALVVRRFTRDRASALFAVAAAALHVAVVRVAASEDAHTLAVLLGWLAFLGFDVYAEGRRRAALALGTLALIAMIHTRQTLYPFVPLAYALLFARGGRGLVRRPEVLVSLGAVLLALLSRAVTTFGTPSEQTSFIVIWLILTTPRLVLDILAHHPLLDVARFGPLPALLLLVGLVAALRRPGPLRWLALGFLLCFLVSLPTAFHTPGVELAFRLPATSLGLALAGVGGGLVAARLGRRPLAIVLLLGLFAWPLALPSFGELRRQSADFLEYQFVRRAVAEWPRTLIFARLRPTGAMPSYEPPLGLLRRAGLRVLPDGPNPTADPTVPRVFFAGVQCWAWQLGELIGLADDPAKVTRAQLAEWGAAVVDGDLGRLALPRARRPECDRLLAHAHPIGPSGTVADPSQDLPFALYGAPSIPLQLYQLDR